MPVLDEYLDTYLDDYGTSYSNPTSVDHRYELFVRNATLDRVAQIDDFTSADFVLRFNQPGSWRINGLPAGGTAAGFLTPGAGVIIRRDGTTLLSGPLDVPTRVWNDEADHLDIEGPDDLIHLWDRIVHPSPADGNFATDDYDVRTGVCSTILRQYVDVNAGPTALSPRRVDGLALGVDPLLGSSVTGRGRFQILGDLLNQLALAGGDIGFRNVQSGDMITFDVYDPADLSTTVIFSTEFGNLSRYEYVERGPRANYVYVAGGGEGTARVVSEGGDSASISRWSRRIERMVDQRQTTVVAELQQKRDEELAASAAETTLEIGPIDTAAVTYGTDYGLGDIVAAVVDGVVVAQVIREVRIELTADGAETVTPILTTPLAGTSPIRLFDRFRSISGRLTTIEGV